MHEHDTTKRGSVVQMLLGVCEVFFFFFWLQGRGMETGHSLPSAPLCERKAELFEHSFKHPGVVGRNVLTLSFSFQSRAFFPPNPPTEI